MLNLWFFLAVLFTALDWSALCLKKQKVGYFSKPAVMLALILWFSSRDGWQAAPFSFGLALSFSLVGDILLLLPDRFFLPGLISFLAAQVCYVIGFNPQSPVDSFFVFATGILVLGVGSYLFNNLRKNIERNPAYRNLITPILFYSLALNMMLFSTILTLAQSSWLPTAAGLVAAGGMLFYASDVLLSANRFIRPIPNGKLLVRILYHLGQLGLTSGILLQSLSA